MKTYVYKITRADNKEYIGITVKLKKRIRDHSNSDRFKDGISNIEILSTCDSYEEAEVLEEQFIAKYNTFHDGLNKSINGKGNHLCETFTTKGFKYSEISKNKMKQNHWSKKGFIAGMKGKNHSEDTKKTWSEKRKDISWGPRKIPLEDAKQIIDTYNKKELNFDNLFLSNFVKKTQKQDVLNGIIELNDMRSPNGRKITEEMLYSAFFAEKYSTTTVAIRNILIGKTKLSEAYDGQIPEKI